MCIVFVVVVDNLLLMMSMLLKLLLFEDGDGAHKYIKNKKQLKLSCFQELIFRLFIFSEPPAQCSESPGRGGSNKYKGQG